MKKTKKITFKDYEQNKVLLLPPSLDELIPETHPVRVVNQVIEKIDCKILISQYKGGGCSSYHPIMLLKVLVYSYLCNIYSSRKIEAALKENIHFMWLSGMNRPDHNTINRFRSTRLKKVLKTIFSEVVLLLADSGHLSLKEIYTDGTKIESKANRYTFVWSKSIKKSKERIVEQLTDLWSYAESVASEELKDKSKVTFDEIDVEKVNDTIDTINSALKDKKVDKKIKQKLSYAKKNWPKNLEKYKRQEEILGERNSFSKTDHDATFMRMKEDHMKNGQLKPGYNLQVSSNNQFILNYSHHHNPTDTTTLESHLKQFYQLYNFYPDIQVADAGYGSEENYGFLESKEIDAYVKYNYFDKEQNKKNLKLTDNLYYNKDYDCYFCPMGQPMKFIGTKKRETSTGYEQTYKRYQAINCKGCPLNGHCNKSKSNKIIERNHNLIRLKSKAKEMLNSELGIKYRKQRCHDVEPVFGNIKHNKGFKRFMLTGLKKTEVETGLLALAHNLAKIA